MTTLAHVSPIPVRQTTPIAASRDSAIDSMRGIAILMVIGIHSLHQQPQLPVWETWLDAAMRPCVPMFLFVSGYLTGLSRRVPLARRFKAILIPYALAFIAAYIYMAMHNPAMDHRPAATGARFLLAYVFVYYYVFVYVGCTILLWLVLFPYQDGAPSEPQLAARLLIAIAVALMAGSYLDPLLFHFDVSAARVEEVRMRDIPFWFGFASLGALVAMPGVRTAIIRMRRPLPALTLLAYVVYAAVRQFQIGDAADYDSVAFFFYAALLCIVLFAFDFRVPQLALLGSGSYFLYLWHIFIVMGLRDHTTLHRLGPLADSAITLIATLAIGIVALLAVRRLASARVKQWLGA
jgi:surface polysaccharide O-acyltransferase-like enzyme